MGIDVIVDAIQGQTEEIVSTPIARKPSLFLASRLAGLVRKFSDRLQERVNARNSNRKVNPFGTVYQRGFRLRALSDLERVPVQRRRLTLKEEPRAAIDHPLHAQWVNELITDFDEQIPGQAQSLSDIAATDRLFLSQSQSTTLEKYTNSLSRPQVAHAFDISCALIDRLDCYARSQRDVPAITESKRLDDPLFIANLIHLLRRLRYILFTVLVFKSLQRLDEAAAHWQSYWQQLNKLGDDWFSEWPDGQRPLSTTWPWNIRPSLVVLWGVCWMFYPQANDTGNNMSRSPSRTLPSGNTYWSDFPPSSGEAQNQEMPQPQFMNDQTYLSQTGAAFAGIHFEGAMEMPRPTTTTTMASMAQAAQPHPYQPILSGNQYQNVTGYPDLPNLAPFSCPRPQAEHVYNEPAPAIPSSSSATTSNNPNDAYPDFQADQARTANTVHQHLNSWGQFGTIPEAFNQYSQANLLPTVLVESVEQQSNVPLSYQPETPTSGFAGPSNLNYGYGSMANQPEGTTTTVVESGRRESAASLQTHLESSSNNQSPSSIDQLRSGRITVRRDAPPPMSGDKFTCNHEECVSKGQQPLFARRSDWNKHMDKHERPYRCTLAGCEKIKGFTYSGGLARHFREVHDQNTMGKPRLFCDIPGCPRSQGKPFTRLENLNEHKRRRHPNPGSGAVTNALASANVSPAESNLQYTSDQQEDSPRSAGSPLSKKRKRETESPSASTMGLMGFKTEEQLDEPSASSSTHPLHILQQQHHLPSNLPSSENPSTPDTAEVATLRTLVQEKNQTIIQQNQTIAYLHHMIREMQVQLAGHQRQPPVTYHQFPAIHPIQGQLPTTVQFGGGAGMGAPIPVTTAPPARR